MALFSPWAIYLATGRVILEAAREKRSLIADRWGTQVEQIVADSSYRIRIRHPRLEGVQPTLVCLSRVPIRLVIPQSVPVEEAA